MTSTVRGHILASLELTGPCRGLHGPGRGKPSLIVPLLDHLPGEEAVDQHEVLGTAPRGAHGRWVGPNGTTASDGEEQQAACEPGRPPLERGLPGSACGGQCSRYHLAPPWGGVNVCLP